MLQNDIEPALEEMSLAIIGHKMARLRTVLDWFKATSIEIFETGRFIIFDLQFSKKYLANVLQ